MNREYVIVDTRYMKENMLVFWGRYTKDSEKRSFGGYTKDLDKCERYTKEELENSVYNFKFYDKDLVWRKEEDFYIKISDLEKLGCKMTVIYV